MQKIYILISLFCLCLPTFASNVQRLRLAKAKSLINQEKVKEGLSLVLKNLEESDYHFESYKFIADYYIEKNQIKIAFELLYNGIKKIHKDHLLLIDPNKIMEKLKTITSIDTEALGLYFYIGKKYFEVSQSSLFSIEFNQKLLLMSKKYFTISEHFNYSKSSSFFYMGMIEKQNDNSSKAKDYLYKAFETYDHVDIHKISQDQLYFELGESLMQNGFSIPGFLYLKKVILSEEKTEFDEYTLKTIENIDSSFLEVLFRYKLTSSSNILGVNDNLKERGNLQTPSFLIFYNRPWNTKWTNTASFNWSSSNPINPDFKSAQTQDISYKLETQYKGLSDAIINLDISQNHLFERATNTSPLKVFKTMTNFSPSYSFIYKNALIKLNTHMTQTNYEQGASGTNLGIGAQYASFINTDPSSYTYEVNLKQYLEEDGSNSLITSFIIDNSYIYNEQLSFYSLLDISFASNQSPVNSRNVVFLSLKGIYKLKYIKDLNLELSLSRNTERYKNADRIATMEASAGFSYRF